MRQAMGAAAVTVTSFGDGRREVLLEEGRRTVQDVVERTGLKMEGRRIAVNALRASGSTEVQDGDLVSLMPRVIGG